MDRLDELRTQLISASQRALGGGWFHRPSSRRRGGLARGARGAALLGTLLAAACGGADRSPSRAAAGLPGATAASRDTTPTIATELARFRANVGDEPARLAGGATSIEALGRKFARAVQSADTAAIDRLSLTPAEFAYLYYPESRIARPPYELDPQIAWLQIRMQSDRGRARLLQRYGGRPFAFGGMECASPEMEGVVTIHRCRLRRLTRTGEGKLEQLFGSIVEREGRYKFVGLANGL